VILVVGATGDLGGRVVRQLRERGDRVRALVRVRSDLSDLREIGTEVVHGDLRDASSLRDACAGAETVIATATAIGRRLAGESSASIHAIDQVGMGSLVDAAGASGVERFVYVSYAGADVAMGSPLERAKLATEEALRASPMRRIIVRPDAYQEIHFSPVARFDIAAGKASIFGKGDTKRRWVATDDVAALIAAAAGEADPPEILEFGGPEAISRNEAVAIAQEASGRAIKVQRLPRPVARIAMRLTARRNDALASVIGAGLHQDLVEASWDDGPLRSRGVEPRPATDFIRAQAEAVAGGV
jgi:uncharacterized protein YbjT (DUF2867 family)